MSSTFTLALLVAIFVGACRSKQQSEKAAAPRPREAAILSWLREHFRDTVLDARTAIRYVPIDSCFDVKLTIGGRDTLLGYRFDTTVPRVLVPVFHAFAHGAVCLKRGYGSDYRLFIVGFIEEHMFAVLSEFEGALAVHMEEFLVVYRNEDRTDQVIVENFGKGLTAKFTLPKGWDSNRIVDAEIKDHGLRLRDREGKRISVVLPVLK